MKIKVTAPNTIFTTINGKFGPAPVGHVMDVREVPAGWDKKVEVIAEAPAEPVAVVNVEPVVAVEPDLDEMRADYLELTGQEADKRWGASTLRGKLEALVSE